MGRAAIQHWFEKEGRKGGGGTTDEDVLDSKPQDVCALFVAFTAERLWGNESL